MSDETRFQWWQETVGQVYAIWFGFAMIQLAQLGVLVYLAWRVTEK